MARRYGLALFAVLPLMAGCGGPPGAAEMIRTAVHGYLTSVAAGNGRAVCAHLSSSDQSALRATAQSAGLGSLSCASIVARALKTVNPATLARQRSFARTATVKAVVVHGDRASLTVSGPFHGVTETMHAGAVREDGRWKLSQVPGQATVGRDIVYTMPSGSMVPTLSVGETILVDPSAYRTRAPAVGDIIVFHPPAGAQSFTAACGDPHQGQGHAQVCDRPTSAVSRQIFVKRIVAGPGDRITMARGVTVRNGTAERQPFRIACAFSGNCTFAVPVTIPANEYFVLGDNRATSDDSRFWGPVKRSWIIGVVVRELR